MNVPPIEQLQTKDLIFDIANPRLLDLKLTGNAPNSQDDLYKALKKGSQFVFLLRSVKKDGVNNAIWVEDNDDGTYTVKEGNRRLACLKTLLEDGEDSAHSVSAHVIPSSWSEKDVRLRMASLQTGKAVWGRYNESAVMYQFHHQDHMAEEDIAVDMQRSVTEVKKSIRAYERFEEYREDTGDTNSKRFSMFDDMPKAVTNFIDSSEEDKKFFHSLIDPTHGIAKIRSVATRNGLRDFAKILEDEEALDYLRTDKDSTIEDAMDILKDNNLFRELPWLKRIQPMTSQMNDLTQAQKAKLTTERKTKLQLQSLRDACEALILDLKAFED